MKFRPLPRQRPSRLPRDLPIGDPAGTVVLAQSTVVLLDTWLQRTSFTEQVAQVPACSRLTTRLRRAAGTAAVL